MEAHTFYYKRVEGPTLNPLQTQVFSNLCETPTSQLQSRQKVLNKKPKPLQYSEQTNPTNQPPIISKYATTGRSIYLCAKKGPINPRWSLATTLSSLLCPVCDKDSSRKLGESKFREFYDTWDVLVLGYVHSDNCSKSEWECACYYTHKAS